MKWTKGYIGTYASEDSKGVYEFQLLQETGELTRPVLYVPAVNAKYTSLYNGILAIPVDKGSASGIALLDTRRDSTPWIGEALLEHNTPCFVLQDKDTVYTANYHQGTVMVYAKEPKGPNLIKRIGTAPKAGCHQVLLHLHYLMVPCLRLQCIRIYDRAQDYAFVGSIDFPQGSGPRHGIFNRDHTRLYVVSEWSCQLFQFRVEGQLDFVLEAVVPLLPSQYPKGSAAALRLSPRERFLYVSIREAELITVLDVSGQAPKPVQYASCGGKHPRDIVLSPDGSCLLAVNRISRNLVSIQRDPITGKLGHILSEVSVPEGVSISLEHAITPSMDDDYHLKGGHYE